MDYPRYYLRGPLIYRYDSSDVERGRVIAVVDGRWVVERVFRAIDHPYISQGMTPITADEARELLGDRFEDKEAGNE